MKTLPVIIAILGIPLIYAEVPQPNSEEKTEAQLGGKAMERGHGPHGGGDFRHRKGGRFMPEIGEKERIRLMYFRHLIMDKYDVNRNGKLDESEKEALRKDDQRFGQERKAKILKKFDKDGDGKLNEEERAAMKKEFKGEMEKRLKKDKEEKEKEDDMRPPMPPPRHGRPPAATEGEGGKQAHPGKDRQGKNPHALPMGMLMAHGYHLMMERFDKDRDGRLSDEELKEMRADREKFLNTFKEKKKKWEEMAKRRKEKQSEDSSPARKEEKGQE